MSNNTDSTIRSSLLNAHIIVVDDKYDNLLLVQDLLGAVNYKNITIVEDPTTVVDLYKRESADLFLIDLSMPVMNGFELIQALNDLKDPLLPPMLVLTAETSSEYRQRALDLGARDYITKPFDFGELIARVRNHLEIQQAHLLLREQNELLEEKVEERTKELRLAHDLLKKSRTQIIRKLGRAAEYRDNETGYHIIRMSKICIVLGKAVGMSNDELDLLLNASPMHDIGKIGIPDNVLLKKDRLELKEWEIMKKHSEIGAHILADDESPLLTMASTIALTHHEKWDGSGYPNGLKEEEIPIVSRISTLADVYDALTSSRPYKNAWSSAQAQQYIKDKSGSHFDPELVEHFFENIEEIDTIIETYTEPSN